MSSLKNYKKFNSVLEGSSSDNAEKYADILLDKIIKGGGIDVLSEREKNFLNGIAKKSEKPVETQPVEDVVEEPKRKRKPGRHPHVIVNGGDEEVKKEIKRRMKAAHHDIEVGDTVVDLEQTTRNLPRHAADFLENNDEFEVKRVNKNGKIDLGCFRRDEEGKKYTFYFSSNRFAKKGEEDKYLNRYDDRDDGDYDGFEDDDYYDY